MNTPLVGKEREQTGDTNERDFGLVRGGAQPARGRERTPVANGKYTAQKENHPILTIDEPKCYFVRRAENRPRSSPQARSGLANPISRHCRVPEETHTVVSEGRDGCALQVPGPGFVERMTSQLGSIVKYHEQSHSPLTAICGFYKRSKSGHNGQRTIRCRKTETAKQKKRRCHCFLVNPSARRQQRSGKKAHSVTGGLQNKGPAGTNSVSLYCHCKHSRKRATKRKRKTEKHKGILILGLARYTTKPSEAPTSPEV